MARHLFKFMYDIAFINIVTHSDSIHVYVELLRSKKQKRSDERIFILNESYKPELLFDYIKPFMEDTPYFYISLLDTSFEQGALPTCNKHELSKYKDLSTSKYRCIDQKWICYTSAADLEKQIKEHSSYGVDFVFSPFVILKKFFKDKIQERIALYVFIQQDALAVAVFQEGRLLYGDYLDTRADMTLGDEIELGFESNEQKETEDESIDLDEIDLDEDLSLDEELEELDDFSELESLDELNGEDDLESRLDANLESVDKNEEEEEEDLEKAQQATEDFKRFTLIQSSLARYYRDERYESDFIENAYIADSVKVGNDFKRYMQEELFLTPYIRSIEPEYEIAQLAKEELGLL